MKYMMQSDSDEHDILCPYCDATLVTINGARHFMRQVRAGQLWSNGGPVKGLHDKLTELDAYWFQGNCSRCKSTHYSIGLAESEQCDSDTDRIRGDHFWSRYFSADDYGNCPTQFGLVENNELGERSLYDLIWVAFGTISETIIGPIQCKDKAELAQIALERWAFIAGDRRVPADTKIELLERDPASG